MNESQNESVTDSCSNEEMVKEEIQSGKKSHFFPKIFKMIEK